MMHNCKIVIQIVQVQVCQKFGSMIKQRHFNSLNLRKVCCCTNFSMYRKRNRIFIGKKVIWHSLCPSYYAIYNYTIICNVFWL